MGEFEKNWQRRSRPKRKFPDFNYKVPEQNCSGTFWYFLKMRNKENLLMLLHQEISRAVSYSLTNFSAGQNGEGNLPLDDSAHLGSEEGHSRYTPAVIPLPSLLIHLRHLFLSVLATSVSPSSFVLQVYAPSSYALKSDHLICHAEMAASTAVLPARYDSSISVSEARCAAQRCSKLVQCRAL